MNGLIFGAAGTVASWFQRFLITITLPFYELSETLFKIFFALARGQVVSPEKYQLILNNFYIIIGIVMLFVTAFALLKMLVNPDDQKNGTSVIKKMIINFITSVAIIVLLPTIFGFMFDIQTSVIDYNLLGNIFGLGTANKDDCNIGGCPASEAEQQAMVVVNSIYLAFFNVDPSRTVMEIPEDVEGVEIDQPCYSSQKHLEVCQAEILDNEHDEYGRTFRDYIKQVNESGNIGLYTNLSDAVTTNHIKLSFFLSLIAGCILVYVVFSYCFDMALRLIKLVFYQMIAPVPILLRIIPEGKASGAFSQWVKIVLSCYFEVYVRLLVIYFVLWLCKGIDGFLAPVLDQLNCSPIASMLATAFVFLGLIMFMKQAPKLIGDITGIDTGGMKLGIKEKLADSGLFAAGAIVGGGVTAGIRNAVAAKQSGKGFWKGAGSTIAGMTSGAFRSGRAGLGAKSFKDMSTAAGSGARGATNARDKRAAYKASHGGTVTGAMFGHAEDMYASVKSWAGFGTNDAVLEYYSNAAGASNSFNDMSEGTYKKKQEYVDQSSIVKALDAELKSKAERRKFLEEIKHRTKNQQLELNEIIKLESQKINAEKVLETMQIEMAHKKRDVIALAATKLAVDQKTNYSGDVEYQKSFAEALQKAFVKVDNKGNPIELDENTQKILTAMQNGQAVNEEWITKNNIAMIQDAIDKANIGRQHIQSVKEREHVVNTGNRPQNKNNN